MGSPSPNDAGKSSAKKTPRISARDKTDIPKLSVLDEIGPLDPRVESIIHQLRVDLTNAQEDNAEYKAEYERIAEEGRLLYSTYASKVNQLKQVASQNAKMQADLGAAKEREIGFEKQLEEERQETSKWKAKFKEQIERFKDTFASLENMKKQAAEDAAMIKRLQAGGGKVGALDVDTERKYKLQIQQLEQQLKQLRQKVDSKVSTSLSLSTSMTASNNVADLKRTIEELSASNELLRDDNKSLLLEVAKAGDGKFTLQAKLDQKDQEVQRLQGELSREREQVARLTKALNEKIEQSEKELGSIRRDHQEAVAALEVNLADSRARVASLEQQVQTVSAMRAELESCRTQIKSFRSADYERRLANAVMDRDAWKSRCEQLSVVLENAIEVDVEQQKVCERVKETAVYLKAEAIRVKKQISAVEEKNKQVDQRLADIGSMEERTKAYDEHIERVEHRCVAMARSLEETERRMEQAAQETAALQKAKQSLEAELEDQRGLIRDMEECSKETDDLNAQLAQRMAGVEAERDAAKAVEAQMKTELAECRQKLQTIEHEYSELKMLSGRLFEASEAFGTELQEKDGETERLRQEIETLQASLEKQQIAFKEVNATLDRKIEEFHRSMGNKVDECNTLRKLLDEARATTIESAADRKKRLEMESKLRELEGALDLEKEQLKSTTEALVEALGEAKKSALLYDTAKNQRDQLKVMQEMLIDSLQTQTCCCSEATQMKQLLEQCIRGAEERAAHVKELEKMQKTIDQQNRYINESKGKSNANIRLLHSQLLSTKEKMAKAVALLKAVQEESNIDYNRLADVLNEIAM